MGCLYSEKVESKTKDRLIIALDTSVKEEALQLVEKLKDHVGYFKIGLELFSEFGPEIIKTVKDKNCKIFFDGKFMDIPNTVSKAVSNMVKHKVDMLNVYMTGGAVMLQEAKKSLLETARLNNLTPPKLLGVTVLTSMAREVLEEDLKIKIQLEEYVLHLAKLGLKNNLDGIICSANEAKAIHDFVLSQGKKDFLIVTPGVRPSWAETNDQSRIATPKEAILNGVTHIVIGRPVTKAKDPIDAAKRIIGEIEEAVRV